LNIEIIAKLTEFCNGFAGKCITVVSGADRPCASKKNNEI
jgi:hypothetical protein